MHVCPSVTFLQYIKEIPPPQTPPETPPQRVAKEKTPKRSLFTQPTEV